MDFSDAAGPFDAAPPAAAVTPGVLEGDYALLLNILLLEKGAHDLARVSDYTATFSKQEAVDGVMGDPQVMFLKLRHRPFSVYFKWLEGDVGRELLYVDGQNDGNMIVRLGGLNERLANDRRKYCGRNGAHCRMDEQVLDDRTCYRFTLEFDSPAIHESYRRSVQFIDKELSLPVCIKNYGWPEASSDAAAADLDEATLIECYRYTDIRLDQQLADADFDRGNREYRFRR
jgi:hypothetical protein